ncbi:helix-hairpin-helix domain-containing protein [Neobacillus vireti]|uniref:helix-hairpin-helix domain-containing protein n=1 Tax=Neobacillus vireti TaxID=220686 RepID=UPI002FFE52C3
MQKSIATDVIQNIPDFEVKVPPIIKEKVKTVIKTGLNHTSKDEIAELPGIGRIFAKKVLQLRVQKPFQSFDEFSSTLNLKPHIAENLRPLVTCEFSDSPSPEVFSGRIIDF